MEHVQGVGRVVSVEEVLVAVEDGGGVAEDQGVAGGGGVRPEGAGVSKKGEGQ